MMDLPVAHPTQWGQTQQKVASGIWLTLASVSVAIWLAGNVFLYQDLHQVCSASPFDCAIRRQLTTENITRLQSMGLSIEDYITFVMTGFNLGASACVMLGILIFSLKGDDRNAWLTALFLVMYGGAGNNTHLRALTNSFPELWLPIQFISLLIEILFVTFFVTFPNGRFVPRPALGIAVAWVIIFTPPRFLPNSLFNWYLWPGGAIVTILIGMYGSLALVMAYRYRHVLTYSERRKAKWVYFGMLIALMGILFQLIFYIVEPELLVITVSPLLFVQGVIVAISLSFIPLSIGVAILHSSLFDIDLLLNRTLVYSALTIFVIGTYALVVGAVGALLRVEGNVTLSLIATGLVAVAFNPLRERLQRAVNRLMYGERDEPYRVLTRLGQQLEAALEPAAALPLTVKTVAHTLKLPYVAIRLKNHTEAAHGEAQTALTTFPLIYAGESLGELAVAPRAPNEPLTGADRRLLTDLAQQVSMAAHATLLTADLERARLRIVTEREEARRQLGSDLHDGVGHQLAGLARKAELAASLLESDASAARAVLSEITAQLSAALVQVRGLAHQLHPPELELLGLAGTLRERAQIQRGFTLHLHLPHALPALPTAVETAAYYIALEALTNVEKHAQAQTGHLRVRLAEGQPPILELEITDDGRGLAAETHNGLGLLSMQARAAEVGGTCHIESQPSGGTRVSVRLPGTTPLP